MKKVVIVGSGGAGKSTLARQLANKTNLPVVHLDAHYWQPGWKETERSVWIEMQQAMMAADQWIIDGNYGSTMAARFEHADTIIYLDLNRYLCIWRAIKRRIRYHNTIRPDMNNGCIERLDWQFLTWLWRYPIDTRPTTLARLKAASLNKQVIHLKSRREVKQFVAGLTST